MNKLKKSVSLHFLCEILNIQFRSFCFFNNRFFLNKGKEIKCFYLRSYEYERISISLFNSLPANLSAYVYIGYSNSYKLIKSVYYVEKCDNFFCFINFTIVIFP